MWGLPARATWHECQHCDAVAGGALVVTSGDRTSVVGQRLGCDALCEPTALWPQTGLAGTRWQWTCSGCAGAVTWHWWLCAGHRVAQLDLHQTPGGTAGSALDSGQHSWLGTVCWAAQLVLHWMLRGTAGSTSAPSRPVPRYQVPWAAPRAALCGHGCCWHMLRDGCWAPVDFWCWPFHAFTQGFCLYLHFQTAFHLSYNLQHLWLQKKSVGLLLFKKKSSIQLFCQEHILPAVMCHLVRPRKVPWQTPGALLSTVSKAFAHACSLYSGWII